jgi:2-desacetyl-2-hydroxyethyl bacteriochlorophyllide A dehydrogenase
MIKVTKLKVFKKGELDYVQIELPKLGKKQALVKGVLSGISHGTELAVINQTTPTFHKHWIDDLRCFSEGKPSKEYPVSLGYEYVGEVVEVGNEVSDLKAGDFVWMDASHQTMNILDVGKTPYLKLSGPEDVEKAVFLALARVSLAAVHDAKPKIGDVFFVSGLGTIGLIVIQLLKNAGVNMIFASDPFELRRKKAEELGAITVDPTSEDAGVFAKKKSLRGVDVSIECSGSSKALHDTVKACGIGGKVVTAATYCDGASNFFMGEEWHRNRITLVSSMSVNGCPHRDYPLWDIDRLNQTALGLLQNGKVKVADFITHKMSFQEGKKAYQLIQNEPEKTLKIVLSYP